jgi:DNA-binding transcriptional ArsR family regulator
MRQHQHALRQFKAQIFQALAHPTRIAIVEALRNGELTAQVYYAVRDPVLIKVLDLLRKYFYAHLNETLAMLGEMDQEGRRRA